MGEYEPTEAEEAYMAEHHPLALAVVWPACEHGWPGATCGPAHPYLADPTPIVAYDGTSFSSSI